MTEPIEKPAESNRIDPSLKPLLRSVALELLIYAPLVVLYFLLVLRLAAHYLADLYYENTPMYAFIALSAILAQGVLLERLTTWLLHRFGLRK